MLTDMFNISAVERERKGGKSLSVFKTYSWVSLELVIHLRDVKGKWLTDVLRTKITSCQVSYNNLIAGCATNACHFFAAELPSAEGGGPRNGIGDNMGLPLLQARCHVKLVVLEKYWITPPGTFDIVGYL